MDPGEPQSGLLREALQRILPTQPGEMASLPEIRAQDEMVAPRPVNVMQGDSSLPPQYSLFYRPRAGAATAIVGLILTIAFPGYAFVGWKPPAGDDPTWLFVIVVSVAMAAGLLLRSRVVALLMLVGAGSFPFMRWMWADLWPWVVVDSVQIVVYARTFEATLAYHAAKAWA